MATAKAHPLVVAPGVTKPGSVVNAPISQVDLFPTLAELCAIDAPKNLQGQSLVPLLKDPFAQSRGWALTQVVRGGGALGRPTVTRDVGSEGKQFFGYTLRTPRWRYTEWDEGRAGRELYDHDDDPRELKNLAEDYSRSSTVAELSLKLSQAVKQTFPPSGETPKLRPDVWAPNLLTP